MSMPALRFKDEAGQEFNEWETKKLSDLAKVYDGTHMTPDYKESGVPFYSVEHLTNNNFCDTKYISEKVFERENKRVMLEKEDILMTRIGDIGTPKYISWDVRASFYVSLALIKKSKKINSLYLSHFISAPYFQKELHQRTIHVAFPKKINLGEISECLVKFPCEQEQNKIANFLTAVDEKITQLTQKHDLLIQYKKGVMQQILSQELRFKDDDGKDFPEWEEKCLGDVGENIIGLTYSPKNVTNEEACPIVLRSSNIQNDVLDLDDKVRVNTKIPDKLFTKKNDILICTRNGSQRLIGKNVLISNIDTPMTFGAFMSVFRSPFNRYIVHLFKTDIYNEQIQINLGATINQITTKSLNSFVFNFPSLKEQNKIANFLTAIDDKVNATQSQLKAIKQYKQGLLQQMFV